MPGSCNNGLSICSLNKFMETKYTNTFWAYQLTYSLTPELDFYFTVDVAWKRSGLRNKPHGHTMYVFITDLRGFEPRVTHFHSFQEMLAPLSREEVASYFHRTSLFWWYHKEIGRRYMCLILWQGRDKPTVNFFYRSASRRTKSLFTHVHNAGRNLEAIMALEQKMLELQSHPDITIILKTTVLILIYISFNLKCFHIQSWYHVNCITICTSYVYRPLCTIEEYFLKSLNSLAKQR